jgi:hypothetical protein
MSSGTFSRGDVRSIVQEREAGEGSVLPPASVASTAKVCPPSARFVYVCPEEQAVKAAWSRLHENEEPGFEEENWNDAEVVPTSAAGEDEIDVSGGVASTVQLRTAGVGSVFDAASVARTAKVCWPSLREL